MYRLKIFLLVLLLTGCQGSDSNNASVLEGEAIGISGLGFFMGEDIGADIVSLIYARRINIKVSAAGDLYFGPGFLLLGYPCNEPQGVCDLSQFDHINIYDKGLDPAKLELNEQGVIFTTNNGIRTVHAFIAIASFNSPHQLTPISNSWFNESFSSGVPSVGKPVSIDLNPSTADELDITLELSAQGSDKILTIDDNDKTSAISGDTFFSDRNGNFINHAGDTLLLVDKNSTVMGASLNSDNLEPKPTSIVTLSVNLNEISEANNAEFDTEDSTSHHLETRVEIYDSQGAEHQISFYFIKSNDDSWAIHFQLDNTEISPPYPLNLNTAPLEEIHISGIRPVDEDGDRTGALEYNFAIDLREIGTSTNASVVNSITSDGYPTQRSTGITIDDCGEVLIVYETVSISMGTVLLMNQDVSNQPGLPCVNGFNPISGDEMLL